jgi:hypothetical protein
VAKVHVLAALALMLILYYFLAEDEERRMRSRFSEGYLCYVARTGMFLPRFLSILPEDREANQKVLDVIFQTDSHSRVSFLEDGKDYLGYVMPVDYVMQGMIANTGDDFHLHKQQHTFALITDWVLNPFEHLRRSPAAQMAKMHHADPAMARRHHCPLGINEPALECGTCPFRCVVFLEIDHDGQNRLSKEGLFAFDTTRVPVCFIDINVSTGEIVNMKKVERATAWKGVPTPAI